MDAYGGEATQATSLSPSRHPGETREPSGALVNAEARRGAEKEAAGEGREGRAQRGTNPGRVEDDEGTRERDPPAVEHSPCCHHNPLYPTAAARQNA